MKYNPLHNGPIVLYPNLQNIQYNYLYDYNNIEMYKEEIFRNKHNTSQIHIWQMYLKYKIQKFDKDKKSYIAKMNMKNL